MKHGKIILSLLLFVWLVGCNKEISNKKKPYQFNSVKMVFISNPHDTITHYNVNKSWFEFILKDKSVIPLKSLQWYQADENPDYENFVENKYVIYLLAIALFVLCVFFIRWWYRWAWGVDNLFFKWK